MKTKRLIKILLIGLLGVAFVVYLALAFTMFNRPDPSKHICQGVRIDIADHSANGFITKPEVINRLKASNLYPKDCQMSDIDIRSIEEMLQQSPFVEKAECYKSQDDCVNISITQRLPVIRVKADNGADYYIDSKDSIMPNTDYCSDLIIATGHIKQHFATHSLAPFGRILMGNELWRNLVEQINVLPDQSIEIVPRVGDHIVYIGPLPAEADDARLKAFVERKFDRLMKFYRYGMPLAGWNKYSYINLEFDNQIVCTRRAGTAHPEVPIHANPDPIAQANPVNTDSANNKNN